MMVRLFIVLACLWAGASWAQDEAAENEPATESAEEAVDAISDEELDDLDLDDPEGYTEEDEDVFRPTDVVSYQQSVPFPVDI